VAAWELTKEIVVLVSHGLLDPLDYGAFQLIFGEIMIVLIALEFKHSIIRVVAQRHSIIQVKTVLLIALLAVSRKFIILDAEMSPEHIMALASVVVALGVAYWLIRDREVRGAALSVNASQ
ncbi:MAG: phosphate-starvation-inducible PsiE family protein, partial [Burkholderiales bacterium]